jgi:DNA-3-methyladenine glycosylase II
VKRALNHLRKADPILAGIIKTVGPYRLLLREPTIETLCRSIVYQQVSGKAAATIFARLKKAVGRTFSARNILKLSPNELRACGLSQQKAAYVRDLAEHVLRKEIDFRRMPEMSDEDVIEHLTRVKGIGVWTAQMFLIFALERPNILPVADLGVRNAIIRAYRLTEKPSADDLVKIAEAWHPYCSVATWYLWRSLDGPAEI